MKSEILVPESLNEISLERYQRFVKLIEDNEESEFVKQKTISILCGVDMEQVRKMAFNSIDEIYIYLIKLFEPKQQLLSRFTFKDDNREFGFIPSLDEMTTGELADLDDYYNDVQSWHKMMAVLYRPVTKKLGNLYDIEPYKESLMYSDLMKSVPVSTVLGAQVFFSDLGKELLIVTMDYLEQMPEQDKQSIIEKHNSEKSGVGIIRFMRSPKETLSRLIKQPE